MSKNVIVNGKPHEGVSFLELLTTAGATALFKDMDEVGGSLPGFAEMASGTFTVDAVKMGNPIIGSAEHISVEHGMSGKPDGFAVFAKHFFDTMDANVVGEIYTNGWNIVAGRRSVEGNTAHPGAGPVTNPVVDDTCIYPQGTAYAKFQPTYKDNEGNEGQQEYIWIAWRIAE